MKKNNEEEFEKMKQISIDTVLLKSGKYAGDSADLVGPISAIGARQRCFRKARLIIW